MTRWIFCSAVNSLRTQRAETFDNSRRSWIIRWSLPRHRPDFYSSSLKVKRRSDWMRSSFSSLPCDVGLPQRSSSSRDVRPSANRPNHLLIVFWAGAPSSKTAVFPRTELAFHLLWKKSRIVLQSRFINSDMLSCHIRSQINWRVLRDNTLDWLNEIAID